MISVESPVRSQQLDAFTLLELFPMPITVRAFVDTDVPALVALKNRGSASGKAVEGFRRELAQPNLNPYRECVLAFDEDRAVGAAYLTVEDSIRRGVLDVTGTGGDEDCLDLLLDQVTEIARSAGLRVMQIDVPETDSQRCEYLQSRGFLHVRTHSHLRREAVVPESIEVPSGMTLREAERGDVAEVTQLQNAAFTGSWGYASNSVEEIGYRIFDLPEWSPDPVLLLEDSGKLLGYCWCSRGSDGSPGLIGMVGVAPDQQGQGLGRVITGAGVDYLVSVGALPIDITVDSQNPPALRVYERLGFELLWRSFWYEISLA